MARILDHDEMLINHAIRREAGAFTPETGLIEKANPV